MCTAFGTYLILEYGGLNKQKTKEKRERERDWVNEFGKKSIFCLNFKSARLQQQSGLSASDSKNSLPSGCYRPLVPPVLNLLEHAAGPSPLLSFILLYFLHLLIRGKGDKLKLNNCISSQRSILVVNNQNTKQESRVKTGHHREK